MEAVAGELVGRDIVPGATGGCALGGQVSDHVAELLRPSDMLVSVHECREFVLCPCDSWEMRA
ncbi:MAG TPA: hypothetical protein VFL61_05615 [Gaiellaceae bacterium]|nr:hypothetical protein [Gaiellaceae bacterium]